jgi:hypothetical protein
MSTHVPQPVQVSALIFAAIVSSIIFYSVKMHVLPHSSHVAGFVPRL